VLVVSRPGDREPIQGRRLKVALSCRSMCNETLARRTWGRSHSQKAAIGAVLAHSGWP